MSKEVKKEKTNDINIAISVVLFFLAIFLTWYWVLWKTFILIFILQWSNNIDLIKKK